MPLLTENQRINAGLAEDARNIAAHLQAAAHKANALVQTMINLDDTALTDWLNSQPPQETMALFAAHGQLGEALNGALTVVHAVLKSSGISTTTVAVDIRSVAEKLAGAGRQLSFENGVFGVTTQPAEPEPETPDP